EHGEVRGSEPSRGVMAQIGRVSFIVMANKPDEVPQHKKGGLLVITQDSLNVDTKEEAEIRRAFGSDWYRRAKAKTQTENGQGDMNPGEIRTLSGTGKLRDLYTRVTLGRIALKSRIEDLNNIFAQAMCDAEDESEGILTIRLRAQTGKYVGLPSLEFCTAAAAAYPWEKESENLIVRFLVQHPLEEQYLLSALVESEQLYANAGNAGTNQQDSDSDGDYEELIQYSLPPPR